MTNSATKTSRERKNKDKTHNVLYQLEVNLDSATGTVWVLLAVVNQYTQLLATDLCAAVPKHKEHAVYHVTLAASIRSNDTGEIL